MQVRAQKSVAYKSAAMTVRKPIPHPRYAGPKAYEVKKTVASPKHDFYQPNRDAAATISRTPARVLAQAAIALAAAGNPYGDNRAGGRRVAKSLVDCCQNWAAKNHQSFNKYFGKALANIA